MILAWTSLLPGAAQADASAQAPRAGILYVYGNEETQLFSDAGIRQARAALEKYSFPAGLEVIFDLYPKPPRGEVPANSQKAEQFWRQLAQELAVGSKAKGIYVLIVRSPGHVHVLADKATRSRGFTHDDEKKLVGILTKGFREAAQAHKQNETHKALELRDQALLEAVNFIGANLQGTTPPLETGGSRQTGPAPIVAHEGNNLAGWICIGLMVLLGVWLIIGIVRAITGMGAAPAGAGGPAGGGGGGGFFSSLLGGLFGSMAGMWLYNNLFGGGSSLAGGNTVSGDHNLSISGQSNIAGEGDFSDDRGAGGDFDDSGGADTGAGGDWGGDAGGDWGGDAGGDWGGDAGGDF
jgi:uncharacterized protein